MFWRKKRRIKIPYIRRDIRMKYTYVPLSLLGKFNLSPRRAKYSHSNSISHLHFPCLRFYPPRYNSSINVNLISVINEQPTSDPVLDAVLEKAKAEERKRNENDPKFLLDSFVSSVKNDIKETEPQSAEGKEAQEEKIEEEIREKCKPLFGELNEKVRSFDAAGELELGRQDYYVLRGDRAGFIDARLKINAQQAEIVELRDRIEAEYQAKGGSKKFFDAFPELHFSKDYSGLFLTGLERVTKEELKRMGSAEELDKNFEYQRDFWLERNRGSILHLDSNLDFTNPGKQSLKAEGALIVCLEAGDDMDFAVKILLEMERRYPLRP